MSSEKAKDIFSQIRDREAPADIVYHNEYVTAFRDISPSAPVHYIIIPNRKLPTLNEATEEDALFLGHMLLAAAQVAGMFGIDSSGYRAIVNCNKNGGQEVFYVHMHVVGGCPLGRMVSLPKSSKKRWRREQQEAAQEAGAVHT